MICLAARVDTTRQPTAWTAEEFAGDFVRWDDTIGWLFGYPFVFDALRPDQPDVAVTVDLGCGPRHVARRAARDQDIDVHATERQSVGSENPSHARVCCGLADNSERGNRMIHLDPSSRVPPYEQVRARLARQIAKGELAVGTRLPTVRQLAADLGLAVNTVARAYRELEEARLVRTQGRSGTFVNAAGERSRARAEQAAVRYATETAELGLSTPELLEIARAALTNASGEGGR